LDQLHTATIRIDGRVNIDADVDVDDDDYGTPSSSDEYDKAAVCGSGG
jgi:hypothetical protein